MNPLDTPVRSITAEQPGAAVTATSLPLATRMSLGLYVMTNADRLALEAIVNAGEAIRLVDVFGREWLTRPTSGIRHEILRTKPLASESTGLRDAHIVYVDLIEVAE